MTNPTVRYIDRTLRLAGSIAACIVVVYTACQLTGYITSMIRSRQASSQLRAEYYEEATSERPSVPPATSPSPTASVTTAPTEVPVPTAAPIDMIHLTTLPPEPYPGNPYRIISNRFSKLRRRNSDIIGWLCIEGMLDEAVVQRDNSYYLRRDYLGYHNVNGALFLDENCDLSTRPNTYIIYGHNMKSGEMFGSLRQYEKLSYYKSHAIITFDTMYEEGQYVVFAVADIGLDKWMPNYAGILLMPYSTIQDRKECIVDLQRLSVIRTKIDVLPEDQFLFLVTCEGNDYERRVIAARRIRVDENVDDLHKIINTSYKK